MYLSSGILLRALGLRAETLLPEAERVAAVVVLSSGGFVMYSETLLSLCQG